MVSRPCSGAARDRPRPGVSRHTGCAANRGRRPPAHAWRATLRAAAVGGSRPARPVRLRLPAAPPKSPGTSNGETAPAFVCSTPRQRLSPVASLCLLVALCTAQAHASLTACVGAVAFAADAHSICPLLLLRIRLQRRASHTSQQLHSFHLCPRRLPRCDIRHASCLGSLSCIMLPHEYDAGTHVGRSSGFISLSIASPVGRRARHSLSSQQWICAC